MSDIEALVRVLPLVTVSATAFTEGEPVSTVTDLVTIRFTIKYDNLKDREFPGFVHSRRYPYLKKQSWWILLTDATKEKTILAHKLTFRSTKNTEGRLKKEEEVAKEPLNEETFEFKQRFAQVGTFRFLATFINDSYAGFEKETLLEFSVVKEDTSRVIEEYSLEDQQAVKGGDLMSQMLN